MYLIVRVKVLAEVKDVLAAITFPIKSVSKCIKPFSRVLTYTINLVMDFQNVPIKAVEINVYEMLSCFMYKLSTSYVYI